MHNVAILYMSGTGNTARAAAAIGEEMGRAGWNVSRQELRRGAADVDGARKADLLVLCFPVLGFGMPQLVRALLKGVRGAGRPAAVFATWGGEGEAALWQARWFLKRKGFRVVAASGTAYPFQWTQVIAPPSPREAAAIVRSGDAAARALARGIAVGRAGARPGLRHLIGVGLGLPVAWLYTAIGRFGLDALYAADASCKACGKCVKACPAGAIVIAGAGEARRPRWRTACQGCNRCINLCPNVQVSPMRAAVHLTVNVAVVAAVVAALGWAMHTAAAQSLPALPRMAAYIVSMVLLVTYGSRLQFAGLEPLLFALEGVPALRRLIAKSWTARFRRYLCPGFRP